MTFSSGGSINTSGTPGGSNIATGGMVNPSFGQGMGQGQLGQLFANLFAQQQAQRQLVPQTIPAVQPSDTAGGRPIALSQQSNPLSQWTALPIILGTMEEAPYVSSGLWMSFRVGDNHNDAFAGYAFGYGPLEVIDIKVGDIDIEDLDESAAPGRPSIEYQLVQTAADDPQDLIEYDTAMTFVNKRMAYNEKMIQVVPQDADLITIAIMFPSGLGTTSTVTVDDYGPNPEDPEGDPIVVGSHQVTSHGPATVSFTIEYRLANTDDDWIMEQSNFTVTKEIGEPLLVNYELEPPELDHYEIRLKRKTTVGDGVAVVNESMWHSVSGILTQNPPYPAPPKGADGSDCTVAGLFIKVSADAEQQSTLEPIKATVSSLIPIFRENLGLNLANYAMNDRPDDLILDSSGNNNHGVFAARPGAFWVEGSPDRLKFNGDAQVTAPLGIDLETVTSYKLEGKFIASGSGTDTLMDAGDAGWILQNHPTNISCVIGGTTLEAATTGVANDQLKFVLEATSDLTTLTATLSVFDIDDILISTDTDTALVAGLTSPEEILIGYHGVFEGIGYGYKGQIFDVGIYVDTVHLAQYAIDDNNTRYHIEGEILDATGNGHTGALTIGSGTWSTDDPPRLNFNNSSEILFPYSIGLTDRTLKIEGWINTNRGASAVKKTRTAKNPILYSEYGFGSDKLFYIFHNPKKKSLEVSLGPGSATDLRITGLHLVDGTDFRFVFEAECSGFVNTLLDCTLSLYDAGGNLLGTDTDSETVDGFATLSNFLIGHNSDSNLHYDGRIWGLKISIDDVLVADYPMDDKPSGAAFGADTILDSSGQGHHGHIFFGDDDREHWTSSPPYRLIFEGVADINIVTPFGFDSNEANRIFIRGSYRNDNDTSGPNTIIGTTAAFGGGIYQDGEDLIFKYDEGEEPFELRVAGGAPLGEDCKFLLDLQPVDDGTPHVHALLNVYTIEDVTIGSDAGDIPTPTDEDNLSCDYFYIANSEFTGRIWDTSFFVQNDHFESEPVKSSNPAYECLYLMRSQSFNPKPVPDELIDFQGFYKWAQYCDQLEYAFHAIIDQKVILWNLVQDVAKAGRAKIVKKNGLYSPVVDMSVLITHQQPVQHFNRFNSTNFRYRNTKSAKIHAVRVNYLDPLNDYQQTQAIVYNVGYTSENATRYIVEEYYGCTRRLLAQRYGRHFIADKELRSKEYELAADWESLVCAIGDHVYVSHDAALIGTASGRIVEKIVDGGFVTSILVDQGCTFEDGKDYAIRLRNSRLESVLANLTNPGDGIYYELTFENDVTEGDLELVVPGDIFQFGEQETESKLMVIKAIDRQADHNARLVMFEYAEGVYSFEADVENGIPEYVSTARVTPQYQFVPPVPVVASIAPDGIAFDLVVEEVATTDVKYLQVQYRIESSDDTWLKKHVSPTEGDDTTIEIFKGLIASNSYEVRVRSISFASVASDWCALETVSI